MNVATRIHNAGMDTQTRITRLVTAKLDTSPAGVDTYWDLLHTEMAAYCHTQELTYAAAELLDTALNDLAYAQGHNQRLQRSLEAAHGAVEAAMFPAQVSPHWNDPDPADGHTAPRTLPAGWITTDGHTE